MKYKFLLFDADNTILDFDKAEDNALAAALQKHGLPFDNHVLATYRKNNIYMWEQLELGLADKRTVCNKRFLLTFEELGWNVSDEEFHSITAEYEEGLHHGFDVIEHADEVLTALAANGHKLYLVSNGILSVQTARLAGSGMGKHFPVRFISEEVGVPKPAKEFFDFAFAHIDGFDPSSALVVGDSLTSDIKGGKNTGVATCWFNPKHLPNTKGIVPDYEIDDLRKLFEIV